MSPIVRRIARDRRHRGIRVERTLRDERVLLALARFRIARTEDLVAFAFGKARKDTAAERLRRLFDSGYLDVYVGDRSTENVYALGPLGKRWVESVGGSVGRVPRDREHHLAIVRAWVGLAVAAHESSDVALDLFRPDWEVLAETGVPPPVVPDAFVQLSLGTSSGPGTVVRFCVEVDRGTESLGTLAAKLDTYERLRASGRGLLGWREFGLAFVFCGGTASRQAALSTLTERRWGGWWVTWWEQDGPRGALEELCRAAQGSPRGLPLR